MYYSIEPENADRDSQWRDFEKTGSVSSYLRYKGIYIGNTDADYTAEASSASETRDGEPIGYY